MPENLPGDLPEPFRVAKILVPILPESVVDELVFEDSPNNGLGFAAIAPAHLDGPRPVSAPQERDGEANLRLPDAAGILLDDEEPGAPRKTGRPNHGQGRQIPPSLFEDGGGYLTEGESHVSSVTGLERALRTEEDAPPGALSMALSSIGMNIKLIRPLGRKEGRTFGTYPTASTSRMLQGDLDPAGCLMQYTEPPDLGKGPEGSRHQESPFHALFASSRDGIFFADLEGRILRANPAYVGMLGYSPSEIILLTDHQLTPPRWHELELGTIREQILVRGYSDEYEKEYIRKDGSVLPVSLRAWLTRDEAGNPTGMWGIVRDITERKRADLASMANLKFLSTLIDTIPSPLFFKDAESRYMGCNAAFEAYLGRPRDQIIGRTVYDIAPKELADVYRKQDQALLDDPRVQIYEARVKYADGTLHDVVFHKAVFKDPDGKAAGLVGVMLDITERKLAEQRLADTLEMNQKLIGAAPIGVAVYQASSGQCVAANEALASIVGATADQVTHQNFREIGSWKPSGMLEAAERALLQGEEQTLETQLTTTFGKGIWASIIFTTFISGGEKHLLMLLSDVTEGQRAKEALQRSETKYRVLAENLSEGLVMTDAADRFVYCNPRIRRMLGYEEPDMLGRTFLELVFDQDKALLQETLERRQGGLGDLCEVRFRRRDGLLLHALFSASPLLDDRGEFLGTVAAFTDITDRRNLEMRLRQAQKLEAVGRLAAGIAHEINTPAQFVSDNLNFLKDSLGHVFEILPALRAVVAALNSLPGHEEAVATINHALEAADLDYLAKEAPSAFGQAIEGVSRITTVVRALKDFAHPEMLDKSMTDINRALMTTLAVARNEYASIADVETELGDIPPLECYLSELNQVFLSLVVNAAEAIRESVAETGAKGIIRVRSLQEGNRVRIDFEDTGGGIPEIIRDKIFDPFFTTKAVGRGSGQGLAIARSIVVEKHRGTLTFTSEPGKGTTFTILLPVGESNGSES
jgi:two-component system, NtrC family, sensor kinase